jgi:hypothetical protein
MATKSDVAFVINYLAAVFANDKIEETTVHAWALSFRETPRMWLARHAMKWAEAEKWFPKIGELRYKIDQEMRGMTRGGARWQPPHSKRDEAVMWLCFIRGIGPDELTIKDLANLPAEEEIEMEPEW